MSQSKSQAAAESAEKTGPVEVADLIDPALAVKSEDVENENGVVL